MRVLLADCNTTDLANWTPTGDAKLYSDLANRVEGDASITLTKEDVLHNYFGMRKYVSTFSLRGNSIHFFVRVNKSLITERKVTGLEFIVYDSDENSIRWVHSLTCPIEIWDVYSCHYYAYLNYPYYPTAYPPNVIRDYAFNPDDCRSIEVRFYTPDPSVMILDKYMVNVDYITLDSVGTWESNLIQRRRYETVNYYEAENKSVTAGTLLAIPINPPTEKVTAFLDISGTTTVKIYTAPDYDDLTKPRFYAGAESFSDESKPLLIEFVQNYIGLLFTNDCTINKIKVQGIV